MPFTSRVKLLLIEAKRSMFKHLRTRTEVHFHSILCNEVRVFKVKYRGHDALSSGLSNRYEILSRSYLMIAYKTFSMSNLN